MRSLPILFSLALLGSCSPGLQKHDQPKSESRQIGDFSSIKASGAAEIDFTTGTGSPLIIEAPADLLPFIVTEVKNGELRIYNKKDFSLSGESIRIHVQSSALNRADLSGACSLLLKNPLNSNAFDLELSGASSFSGTLYNSRTDIEMTGASSAEIAGITNVLEVNTSGAATLNAGKLSSVHAKVESVGASNTTINTDSSLNAHASGASSIDYTGNPVILNKNASGASSISRK